MNRVKLELAAFQKKNPLLIENVMDGFEHYPNRVLEGSQEYIECIIKKLVEQSGWENCYVDCYYGRLSVQERENIKHSLSVENYTILEQLKLAEKEIYLQMTPEILNVMLELTIKELLFSTFYFPTWNCTVWGNYGLSFPVFFLNEESLQRYEKLLA